MKSLGAFVKAARSPVEGVVGIFSAGLFFYACYLLSPWYVTSYDTALSQIVRDNAELGIGLFFIICTLPGLIAPFLRKERRERSLKLATFGIFLGFLFLTIMRIVLFGWIPLTWLPQIMISLASAYLHIWLKVRRE